MKPRYRKSTPENKSFNSDDEMDKYVSELINKQYDKFNQLGEELKPQGFKSLQRETIPEKVAEALDELLARIDLFCPHIDVIPPRIEHVLLPSIRTACCNTCLHDFIPMLLESAKTPECDMCSKRQTVFVEISIPIGFGVMTINVGEDCCADIFIG